jgi:O-glycosyl hydrolase
VVVINPGTNDVITSLHLNNAKVQLTTSYLTSETDELKAVKINGDRNVIPARSIVTLTGIIK